MSVANDNTASTPSAFQQSHLSNLTRSPPNHWLPATSHKALLLDGSPVTPPTCCCCTSASALALLLCMVISAVCAPKPACSSGDDVVLDIPGTCWCWREAAAVCAVMCVCVALAGFGSSSINSFLTSSSSSSSSVLLLLKYINAS